MTLTKQEKKNLIDDFSDKISRSKAVVLTNYKGLKVQDLTALRRKLKEKNIDYKVVKNTLVKIVLKNKNLKVDDSLLDIPAAIAFGYEDEVEPNRIIYQFAKSNDKLEILGGIVNGEFIDVNTVKSLALMPSREELYAKVVGSVAAPVSGFVNVLAGNLRGLVSILKQYQEKKSE